MRQATRAQFIVTIRSLILQSLYFVHNGRESYFQIRDKPQNGTFEGLGVGFVKFSYLKVGRAVPHSEIICTHNIHLLKQLAIILLHLCPEYRKMLKYLDLPCVGGI